MSVTKVLRGQPLSPKGDKKPSQERLILSPANDRCFRLPRQDSQWRGKTNLFLNGRRGRAAERDRGTRQCLPSWRGGSRWGHPVATIRTQPGRQENARIGGAHCPPAPVLSLQKVQDRRGGFGLRGASSAPRETPVLLSRPGRGRRCGVATAGSAHLKNSRPEFAVFRHRRLAPTHTLLLHSGRDSSPLFGCGRGRGCSRCAGGGGGGPGLQPRAIATAPAHFLFGTNCPAPPASKPRFHWPPAE